MENLFHRVKQNRIYQDVAEQIQTLILEGHVVAGEKLPSARELCDMFQTSNGILQEALKILEQKSLVEIRPGIKGGTYVKNASAELMAENLAMLIRSHTISLQHLAEFREGIEGAVAALAASRSMAADNQTLVKLIDEAARCREEGLSGWNRFVQVDEKIHTEIARIAGNPLYNFVLHSIYDNIHRYYDKFLPAGEVEMEENFQDLQLIVQSIAAGESDKARQFAIHHVRRFSSYLEQKKRQNPEL
ncbi:FadR/GntR family transcriptional regulator [Desulfopila inferna]|uniref:FadR/GntR family transcriptional regulator n=1 Tax=Desulfopila inferna TaxID=468528 RepID=UPI001965238D|nr:FCD domain-containing protein [Desulfopila inferna]MBM9604377.1 FadR family transcriptional regulator [Desulfopila inferna]